MILNRTHISWMMRGLARWLDGDNELTPTERCDAEETLKQLRSLVDGAYSIAINAGPKCPKCGAEMGPQTVPNDGTWWCPNIKCGHSEGPLPALTELRRAAPDSKAGDDPRPPAPPRMVGGGNDVG
jgi:hypothetical protein